MGLEQFPRRTCDIIHTNLICYSGGPSALLQKIFRSPDFKLKITFEAAKNEIATMAFDQIQPSSISASGVRTSFGYYDEILKLSEEGRLKEALYLLQLMAHQSSVAPKGVYVCLLRGCTRRKALAEGKLVHAFIVQAKYDTHIFLSNLLIDMYSNCGCVVEAMKVFAAMPQRNVFSWTAMISAYVHNGQSKEALTLFQQMQQAGLEPLKLTFVVALKACGKIGFMKQGQQLHTLITKRGFGSDVIVQTSLIDMYKKCGSLKDAREVFNNMPQRDVVSWNAMISGYAQKGFGKEALDLYEQMKHEGMEPSNVTFTLLLKACASISALKQGRELHSLILEKGFESEMTIQNSLLDMYAKCDCLKEGHELFNRMSRREVVSWNVMIAGYAQTGLGKEALDLYEQMKLEGIKPNKITLLLLLKACTSTSALEQGKELHSLILEKGGESETIIQNTLLDMYAKCGCLKDARELFNSMPQRDVVSWNVMIAAYTQEGHGKESLDLYEQMKHEHMEPDNVTLVLLLKACASIAALDQGKELHSLILERGFESKRTIQNTLIDMYAKCGCIKDAQELFNNMHQRDVISWSIMIAGYVQRGLGKEALDLYKQMKHEGVEPDHITLVLLLKACACSSAIEQGKQLHRLIVEKGIESEVTIQIALVDMYAKCGCLEDARELFNKMHQRDVVSLNAIIAGYAQRGLGKDALDFYDQMKHECVEPNNITLVLLLKACASISALERGKELHSLILEKGFESETFIQTALLDMHAKCGCIKDARELFDNMHQRDVVSWNAMIDAYGQKGLCKEALDLHEKMKHEGIEPDHITFVLLLKACATISALEQGKQLHSLILEKGFECETIIQTTLLDMYAKCGCVKDAHELFNNMHQRNVVSWNAMIAGYAQKGLGKEALDLYKQMEHEGIEPNDITLILLLKACASISALQQGKQLHSLILEKGLESESTIQNSLLDMYAKCGCLKDARDLFNNMHQRDVVSWNAMIAGYAHKGLIKEALDIYEQMKHEGFQANEVTYTCVLSACSHSGLLDEGQHVFESMCKDHGATPTLEHYACMVDLLGRAGFLADAEDFVLKMPIQPHEAVWMSLLGAARRYVNVEIGRRAFERILELKAEENAAPYLLLMEIYLAAGRMDEVAQLRNEMKHKRLEKGLKCSWSKVDKQVHSCTVG